MEMIAERAPGIGEIRLELHRVAQGDDGPGSFTRGAEREAELLERQTPSRMFRTQFFERRDAGGGIAAVALRPAEQQRRRVARPGSP